MKSDFCLCPVALQTFATKRTLQISVWAPGPSERSKGGYRTGGTRKMRSWTRVRRNGAFVLRVFYIRQKKQGILTCIPNGFGYASDMYPCAPALRLEAVPKGYPSPRYPPHHYSRASGLTTLVTKACRSQNTPLTQKIVNYEAVALVLCAPFLLCLKFVKEFLRFSLSGPGHWEDDNTKNHEEWPKTSRMATASD